MSTTPMVCCKNQANWSLAQSQKQERSHKQELEMNFNELSFMQPFLETRWDTLHDIVATWPRYFFHLFFTEADDSSRFSVNDADFSHQQPNKYQRTQPFIAASQVTSKSKKTNTWAPCKRTHQAKKRAMLSDKMNNTIPE